MASVGVEHEDGTIELTQRAPVAVALDELRLEQLYWETVRRVTLGSARFSGDAIRLLCGRVVRGHLDRDVPPVCRKDWPAGKPQPTEVITSG